MRCKLMVAAVVALAGFATSMTAQKPVPYVALGGHVVGTRIRQTGLVVFAGNPIRVQVQLMFTDPNAGPPGTSRDAGAVSIPNDWWKLVVLRITDAAGRGVPVTVQRFVGEGRSGRDGEVSPDGTLALGETILADWDLEPLPVGSYSFSAEFDTNQTSYKIGKIQIGFPDRFVVRRGDETPVLREYKLREEYNKTRDFERARSLATQIAKYAPDDASIFERLAIFSLDAREPEETLEYYDHAVEILRRTLGEAEKTGAKPERITALRTYLKQMSVFRAIYPKYLEKHAELKLVSTGDHRLAWVRREDNRGIGIINVDDPTKTDPMGGVRPRH